MNAIARLVSAAVATLAVFALASPAGAHCDSLSGPVVAAARSALAKGSVQPVLKWVKPDVERELSTAFAQALAVRSQGGQARELADRYFLETVVRLHRAGEGAPYSGLKSEADDPGGVIAASDRAIETGSADELVRQLTASIAAALRDRHARVVQARKHADHNVEAGRQYVQAYVEYVHFAEGLARSLSSQEHAEVTTGHQHRH